MIPKYLYEVFMPGDYGSIYPETRAFGSEKAALAFMARYAGEPMALYKYKLVGKRIK